MPVLKTASIAANRFGFGTGPGELAAVAQDPRGWLQQQLTPEALQTAGHALVGAACGIPAEAA